MAKKTTIRTSLAQFATRYARKTLTRTFQGFALFVAVQLIVQLSRILAPKEARSIKIWKIEK